MGKTTLIRERGVMTHRPLDSCHGGVGAVDWVDVLGGSDVEGRTLEFIHDDVLAPGVSIGVHAHGKGEEYYYIVCGDGTMTLDGERFPVTNGSVTAVFAGGAHGLENTGTRDLRVIVIGIR